MTEEEKGTLLADIQHIMLKNTKKRDDLTEYVHYGTASLEIIKRLEDFMKEQHDD